MLDCCLRECLQASAAHCLLNEVLKGPLALAEEVLDESFGFVVPFYMVDVALEQLEAPELRCLVLLNVL